jgi:DNA-binding SARP family transcriptional activator
MDSLASRHDVSSLLRRPPESKNDSVLGEVFDCLPHGIAVTDRVGAVLVWNRALEELLDLRDGALGRTCCELFGCGTPSGPRDGCLTEQSIRAGGRPLEAVIDRPEASPLWISVAPLRDDSSRLVFELRNAPDQRTLVPQTARVSREPRLRVFTLGRTEVLTPEGPLGGEWVDQRAGQVLKYLVCERHRVVPADEIAESVCRHAQHSTLSTVRYFIHALRTKLEPGRPKHDRGSVVVARHGGYTLNHSDVWIDVDEFEAQVNSGLAALGHGDRAAAGEHFETALSLYHGDFLADEPYAEWALMERERLHALAEKPLRGLGELHGDDPDAAAGYLERLARMEPFDGAVQRELLTLWLRQGRLSRATRHYQAFRQRLLREFGEHPAFSLSELMLPSHLGGQFANRADLRTIQ